MEKLELIKIETVNNVPYVGSLKDLYLDCGMNKSQWARWSDSNIIKQPLYIEGMDYKALDIVSNGNKTFDFIVTVDMAKHLIMQMKTDKAHKYRDYLIKLEKAWNSPDMVIARALQMANTKVLDYQQEITMLSEKVTELKPKADFYEAVTGSTDTIDLGQVAKVLNVKGYGRNNLFEFLRNKDILMDNNQPYQKFIDRGYFRLVESKFTKPCGSTHINIKTVVYQKGVDYIRKQVVKESN